MKEIIFEKIFDQSLQKKVHDFMARHRSVSTLTNGLLVVAVLGGVFTVGVVAPNLFRALPIIMKSERRKRVSKDGFLQIRRSFYHVRKQKWLEESKTRWASNES